MAFENRKTSKVFNGFFSIPREASTLAICCVFGGRMNPKREG